MTNPFAWIGRSGPAQRRERLHYNFHPSSWQTLSSMTVGRARHVNKEKWKIGRNSQFWHLLRYDKIMKLFIVMLFCAVWCIIRSVQAVGRNHLYFLGNLLLCVIAVYAMASNAHCEAGEENKVQWKHAYPPCDEIILFPDASLCSLIWKVLFLLFSLFWRLRVRKTIFHVSPPLIITFNW